MLAEAETQEPGAETEALQRIAIELAEIKRRLKPPAGALPIERLGLGRIWDPKENREQSRDQREAEQARLYRLIVMFAAVSSLASVASVVIAVINAP
jgi:hypothetical protein